MNLHQAKNKNSIGKAELKRLLEMSHFEEEALKNGFTLIAGVDEAGRGPLAGPVVAAACIMPKGRYFAGVNDSKLLTPKKREEIFQQIKSSPDVHYAVGVVDHLEIDRINILQASIKAMLIAVQNLHIQPDYLLIDAIKLPHPSIPVCPIIKGDSKSYSIAVASIIAKEVRDALMVEYHEKWPEYRFDKHKGYGTRQHLEAIRAFGVCPIHRMTFKRGPDQKVNGVEE